MPLPPQLVAISEQVKAGEPPRSASIRMLLSMFNAQRRGYTIVQDIRNALRQLDLTTVPDFESVHIGARVRFVASAVPEEAPENTGIALDEKLLSTELLNFSLDFNLSEDVETLAPSEGLTETHVEYILPPLIGGNRVDPTHRISRLPSANRDLVIVTPDTLLNEAISLMLSHDYSQLPVMVGERTVKGMLSWSSIGQRMMMGVRGEYVRQFMEPVHEVPADTSMFAAIHSIIEQQYVLVRGAEQKITGIVTTSDLTAQFQQLAEPFLLLGEIEQHIRRMIADTFTADELRAVCDPGDSERAIDRVDDLTLGEYIRLLEHPEHWSRVRCPVDRVLFTQQIDQVRKVRNDVMHFDPDGMLPEHLELLRNAVRFLRRLQELTPRQ